MSRSWLYGIFFILIVFLIWLVVITTKVFPQIFGITPTPVMPTESVSPTQKVLPSSSPIPSTPPSPTSTLLTPTRIPSITPKPITPTSY